MLISITEVIYFVILTLVVGYIFTGKFSIRPKTLYDMQHPRRFDWRDFKFSILIASPAVLFHELAHKFVAMGFGYEASFHIWPFGLILAVFLKLISSPLLIIAPGYVGISTITNALHYRLVAFAGPFINLILWLSAELILKNQNLNRKQKAAAYLTKQINMLLFIFNMIPLQPLDGAKVLFGP